MSACLPIEYINTMAMMIAIKLLLTLSMVIYLLHGDSARWIYRVQKSLILLLNDGQLGNNDFCVFAPHRTCLVSPKYAK